MNPPTGEVAEFQSFFERAVKPEQLVPVNAGQWIDTVIDGKNVTFEIIRVVGQEVTIQFRPARIK